MVDIQRRLFFRDAVRQIGRSLGSLRQDLAAPGEPAEEDFFASYESSYALTLAYPDDLVLDAAQRAGIDTQGKDKGQIMRELFAKPKNG